MSCFDPLPQLNHFVNFLIVCSHSSDLARREVWPMMERLRRQCVSTWRQWSAELWELLMTSRGLYPEYHLSRCFRNMWIPTFAIYITTTLSITWLNTCHTRCGLNCKKDSEEHAHLWDGCAVVWHDGSKSDEFHNEASNDIFGLFL